ncbi:OprD family outer membrane porin [Campylobacterota bacterium]
MSRLLMFFLLALFFLSVQADNSLSNAFKHGKVLGELTFFSYNIDKKNEENTYATALGGFLKYTTDNSKPLFVSARFHHSSPVGPDKNREQTQLFDNDHDASSLTTLSESYLAYHHKDRIIKVGNMMLDTPMMNDDRTRIVPWSYRGLAFTSESLLATKLQVNYITRIRSNTSNQYKKESGSGKLDKGIAMLGLTYEAIENFSFQSYYYHVPELYSTFVGQIDYKHVMNENYLICMGVQYYKSGNGGMYNDRTSRNGGDDINLIALKAGIDANKVEVNLYYSQNFGISGIVKGYGGLSKVYTTSMVANGRGNFKPETWMLKSRYDFDPFEYGQSEFAIWLTHTRVHDPRGNDFNAYYSHLRHYFNSDTSVYLRFEAIDYLNEHKNDVNYLRLIASYDF